MAKVLVFEDECNWLELIRERLEEMGHEVCATSDGIEAFRVIESEPVDIVVLDVQMPLNGRAFLWYVEKYKPEVPVLVHSAFDAFRFDPDFDGKAGFAVKSPDLAELTLRMNEILAGR